MNKLKREQGGKEERRRGRGGVERERAGGETNTW